jgi:SSS family solute:Na+ symporter
MSTASATLLAASTILANDVYAEFFSRGGDRVRLSRVFTLLVGVAVLVISLLVKDVVGSRLLQRACGQGTVPQGHPERHGIS